MSTQSPSVLWEGIHKRTHFGMIINECSCLPEKSVILSYSSTTILWRFSVFQLTHTLNFSVARLRQKFTASQFIQRSWILQMYYNGGLFTSHNKIKHIFIQPTKTLKTAVIFLFNQQQKLNFKEAEWAHFTMSAHTCWACWKLKS